VAAGNTYELFSASAERHAERLAVVDRRGRWTYAELSRRVDEIAAAIAAQDVLPGGRVGLLLERTGDAVAAMLAAWKCGTAYVPLAAGTPPARANAVFRSSAVRLVLTDGAADVGQLDGVRSLDLRAVSSAAELAPAPRTSEDELAYVIYTSGTTGQPKGVMIEHRSVRNLAEAHGERIYREFLREDRGLRATLGASFAFDGAVERLLQLLSGHTLFVVADEERTDPERYLAYAVEHALEVLDLTPAFLRSLIRCGLLTHETWAPRLAIVGGEAIPEPLWRELAAASRTTFYNVYGPTETTVNASVARIDGERPHLGHALANTRIYVLDEDGSRVADGEEGEIHVAGAGVARGYHGMPELTAAKFKPNPFADGDALYAVMYVTGDLGRVRADGALEFRGRTDEQIKLRGFRIEPEEITRLLCRRPDVEDAVVRVRTSADGEHQRLVAYVVSETRPQRELSEELRALLREQLPDYMVPGRIVVVEQLPLTPTGKIDDGALAALDEYDEGEHVNGSLDGITPELVAIWEEVLDARGIDPHASFFELGGHSLSAVAMIGRVNEAFDVELPIATVFTAPTITSFDEALREARQESASRR
jgi:amino acid adenylation domain-containing protein